MLLTVDIGNTNINFGLFRGKRLIRRFRLSSREKNKRRALNKIFRSVKIDDAVICSVVPELNAELSRLLARYFKIRPYIIGKDIKVPVRNLYRRPAQVGQDRLVNAYAGIEFYGAPVIVIDFGTAVTFDVVNQRKEYLGGLILPGLRISLEALSERTALLPKIRLVKPRGLIGRDTQSSMINGVVGGFVLLADSLIKELRKRIKERVRVIVTGGDIKTIGSRISEADIRDPDLTLKGLQLIFKNKKNS